jgi:ligand-binding SRPBCC domain-containing protein
MKTYLLRKEIIIAAPLEEVWHFFSNPENLQKITPPYMKFRIIKQPDSTGIFDGMQIEYKVSPILNIPMKWVTLIKSVDWLKSFTDIQFKGPYALWEHTHTFESVPEGTLMYDHVKYALPFGIMGVWAHKLFVARQLESIFQYRARIVSGLFKQSKI